MLKLTSKLAGRIRCQRGQVLVMGIAVLILGLGAITIAVDVGWWLRDKRDAQNDVDAIAHAAAQDLPDRAKAELSGLDYADANGIDAATEMVTPDCPDGQLGGAGDKFCFIDRNGDGADDKVRVKVSRPSNSFIADALGISAPTLNPSAAAATTYVRAACVMPWGIVGVDDHREHIYHLNTSTLYVFQNTGDFVGTESSPGNFGAISIYGEGADTYAEAIQGRCAPRNKACTSDPMVYVNETLANCTTETGTKGSVTDRNLDTRFSDAPSPGFCDAATLDQALNRVENPDCEDRLVPVAVINAFPPSGSSTNVNIYGIVNFYLAGWSSRRTCFNLPTGQRCGFVWGYLIPNAPVSTALAIFTTDFIAYSPTGVAIVE